MTFRTYEFQYYFVVFMKSQSG